MATAGSPASFDLDTAWDLAPQVAVRPERFGALLYHFGTRRLSFLKSPQLLRVLTGLGQAPDARSACRAADVPDDQLDAYRTALATLAGSDMITRRSA